MIARAASDAMHGEAEKGNDHGDIQRAKRDFNRKKSLKIPRFEWPAAKQPTRRCLAAAEAGKKILSPVSALDVNRL